MISLVTGGAGFMGSHLTKELLDKGYNVVVLDDLSGGFVDQIDPRSTFINGSILDHDLLEEIFLKYKFDYVYHLAAYAAEGLSHFIRRFNYNNNLIGGINLINMSVKYDIKCFVFTSSIAVYGSQTPPMVESMSPVPEDPYGVAKLAVELDLYAAKHMFGLNYVIFRPHNVYGEYQNIGDKYRNVIGIFMNQLLSGEPITIFGDGNQKRAFTYVGDIIPTIANCVNVPESFGEVFNIGSDITYSINELTELVSKSIGINGNINYLDSRNEVSMAFSDHTKVNKFFGRNKETSLITGLVKMSNWVKKIGPRKTQSFGNIEIEKKLPSSWINNQ